MVSFVVVLVFSSQFSPSMAENSESEARNGSFDVRRRSVEEVEKKAMSFKMSRKSDTASRLKALISDKLHRFLGDYSDEVLAEYIIVLVCNGKNKYQAREDLEAFLGERSGEFVAWLWELLWKHFSPEIEDHNASYSKGAAHFCSNGSFIDRCSKIDKSRDFKHNTADPKNEAQSEKTCEPSETLCINAPTKNIQPHKESKNDILRRASATEIDNFKSSAYNYPRKISSAVVAAYGKEVIGGANISKNAIHHNPSEPHHQLLHLQDRQQDLWNPQSAPSGRVVSVALAAEVSHQKDKPRVSVWDRLGKPCGDTSIGIQSIMMPGISVSTLPAPNWEPSKKMASGVGNTCYSFKSHTVREMERAKIAGSDQCFSDNVKRKRHSDEISTNADNVSGDFGHNANMGLHYKVPSQVSKKPNMIAQELATPKLVSDVLDMKQKLQQIEIQLSQLRTKQLEREKDGKPVFSSKSCELKHQKKDIESRTVYVTNVNFAATNEAISLYFSKCGVVENVMILTDQATYKPKGAAFVTFASKESADKAISLDGTVFYSRRVKVMPKSKASGETGTTLAQFAGKICKASLPHISRNAFCGQYNFSSPHLQWRRGPSTSTQSEPPAPAGTQGRTALPIATLQMQLSGSTTD